MKLGDDFSSMSDEQVGEFLKKQGYNQFRKLPDGEWAIIVPLCFTTAVCLGAGMITMYKYRWCFEDPNEAQLFFETCENYDDIPKNRASLRGHRYATKPLLEQYDEFGLPIW